MSCSFNHVSYASVHLESTVIVGNATCCQKCFSSPYCRVCSQRCFCHAMWGTSACGGFACVLVLNTGRPTTPCGAHQRVAGLSVSSCWTPAAASSGFPCTAVSSRRVRSILIIYVFMMSKGMCFLSAIKKKQYFKALGLLIAELLDLNFAEIMKVLIYVQKQVTTQGNKIILSQRLLGVGNWNFILFFHVSIWGISGKKI